MFDKLLIALISPLGSALVLGALVLLLACKQFKRSSWLLGLLAWIWLGGWSLPVASHYLRGLLEAAYPAVAPAELPQAQAIVVLGGGIRPPERGQTLPNLNSAADRVWHAARLFHAGKAPLLVLSGGSNPAVSATSEAQAMRGLLTGLGVPDTAMLLEEESRNTRQNAQFSAGLLRQSGLSRILLVTSALHMPRAVPLFEAQGFTVIPAAIDHEARQHFSSVDWLPDASALEGSARAMKELLGRWAGC